MRKINRFETTSGVFLGKKSFPLIAKTLMEVAKSGPGEFYRGAIPSKIARHVRDMGGILSEEDFERYAPRERKPVRGRYRDHDVLSMPPPSAGGALLIHGLGVLEELGGIPGGGEATRVAVMAALIESMLKDKGRFGDPDFVEVPLPALISREAIKETAKEILARPPGGAAPPLHDIGSTTHFCVVDRKGNAVAATETVECYYGSGVTVPGLGVLLNDEMHDFDIASGKPNSVAPLKRPASSMSPTILLKDDLPTLILGASGSERIISSIFQVITNVFERGMGLVDALAAPRLHPLSEGLMLEPGLPDSEIRALESLGLVPKVGERPGLFFGGVQALMVDQKRGSVTGVADPRRRGVAVSES